MEAYSFVVKIKANGTDKDWRNLDEIYKEFKIIIAKLTAKDRGTLSLNVLCTLCRNIDKVPTWRDAVDAKDLLILSIDCVRETRSLNRPEQVKTLACIYHIHRYIVRQSTTIPPELILKLSYMPFEYDTKNLLTEYYKTYWNIIVDRLSFIEQLKGKAIHKLLPKMTEDILKIINIYDTEQFCNTILTFLVKKLNFIYSETYSELLNGVYIEIFKQMAMKNDLKNLKEKESLELYVKFNDCIYVIAENASKVNFKGSALTIAVHTALALLGHNTGIFHCLQMFYINTFCDLFENNNHVDVILKNITVSCDTTKKLGYTSAMNTTYPYLNQFLRLFIEYSINKAIKNNFTVEIQESCLNLMLILMSELKNCHQLLKCENCGVRNGVHDALRLSFLLKHFITHSINYNMDLIKLSLLYNSVITQQYNIMNELKRLKCSNHEKYFRKLQTDTHNIAIQLNKSQKYELSIRLFNIYLENELKLSKHEIELKNISRALYNKGICELDSKLYEDALVDAFLSLVYAEELSSDKHMSLVMDIKAKALKAEEQGNEALQLMTVLEACKMAYVNNMYGNVKQYVSRLKFSGLLKHEFSMYVKLWPSILPIAGVWISLNQIITGSHDDWITDENEELLLWTLFEIITETTSAVRTIHNDHFKMVSADMLARVEKIPEPLSSDLRVIQTILLFLNTEFDIAEASDRYNWKVTEPTMDPDVFQAIKTLPHEHKAMEKAIQAVEIWTELTMELNTVSRCSCLRQSLGVAEIFVQQLLHVGSVAHGLQLAYICCLVAQHIGDKMSYVRCASVLLCHADKQTDTLRDVICEAMEHLNELMNDMNTIEVAVTFICDMAIYYSKCGLLGASTRLVQLAQSKLLQAYEKYPDFNLDLCVGALLHAQAQLCRRRHSGPSAMSGANGLLRHYLSIANTVTKWSARRLRSATLKYQISVASMLSASLARSLQLARRARSAAGAALASGAAHTQATLYATIVNTHKTNDAQVKIDNRLKYILGLQPSPDQPADITQLKLEAFTPKQDFETMLDSNFSKNQLSPTVHCKIPKFQLPEYFKHTNCTCYACVNPNILILSCLTAGLEASMYFRSQEFTVAENYFNGVKDMFQIFDRKLKDAINMFGKLEFEGFIVDSVKRMYENDLRKVQLEVLVEEAYFDLKMMNLDSADDCIVTIHEILQDFKDVDGYLTNEVMNLLVASAKSRKIVRKSQNIDLITEFDNLKLSPVKNVDPPKTPVTKSMKLPPVTTKVIVNDEEIPKKLKVIKLNLDEGSSDEKEPEKTGKRPSKRSQFKIPVPITSKPVLETMTPRITRKPDIVVTNTETPKLDRNSDFFTPKSTPEQFFTPMTSVKSYTKVLRKGIVKNLEEEFSTPKGKENIDEPSKSRANRALRRATSPGKLVKETQTRASRRVK